VVFGLYVNEVVIADFVLAAVGNAKHRNSRSSVVTNFDLGSERSVYQLADQISVAQCRYGVWRSTDTLFD
jgi:hypothetical protein